jgi:hypothetical protein
MQPFWIHKCVSQLSVTGQNAWVNQPNAEKGLFLAHGFRGFSAWLLDSVALGLRLEGMMEKEDLPHYSQETKREEEKSSACQYPFKGTPPSFLQAHS